MDSLFDVLDHLVYVTPDIDQTIADLTKQLGVTAIRGGQHRMWGTRNALLALGTKIYLEIMGSDPTLSRPGLKRPFGIDQLYKARLATWVSRSTTSTMLSKLVAKWESILVRCNLETEPSRMEPFFHGQ